MDFLNTRTIVSNLTFPEGPRWHNNALWFSDFYSNSVYSVSLDGELHRIVEVPHQPSGLGWTESGELLIVSMLDQRLLRWDGKTLEAVADLSSLAKGPCNDMIVDDRDTAYIGNFGFDVFAGEKFHPTQLIRVYKDGALTAAADDLHFPNGAVTVNQGRTLVIAESYAQRLTAFDVAPDGALTNRRIWADLGEHCPDGICTDQKGGVWAATPGPGAVELIRVEEGGNITHEIRLEREAYACAITDDDHWLLVCTSEHSHPGECRNHKSGRIEKIDLSQL